MTISEIHGHLLNHQARNAIKLFFTRDEIDAPIISEKAISTLMLKYSDLQLLCAKQEYKIQNFQACLIILSVVTFRRSLPKYEDFLSELDPLNSYLEKLVTPKGYLNDLLQDLDIKKIQIEFNAPERKPVVITDNRIVFHLYQHLSNGLREAYREFIKPNFRKRETYAKQGKTPISAKKMKIVAAKSLCYLERNEPRLGKNVIPFLIDLFHLADVKALDEYKDFKTCRDSLNRIAKEHAIRKP